MTDTKQPSLFEQFNARTQTLNATLLTDVACANVTQGIGALRALGVPSEGIQDFCTRTIGELDKYIPKADPSKPADENWREAMKARG